MQPPIPAPLKVPPEFLNEPAAAGLLEAIETTLGRRLPEDYAALMRSHDGGAFSLGKVEVSLWTLEELPEWNATFKVATYSRPC